MSRVAGGAVSIETRHVGPRAVLVLTGHLDYRAHRALRAAYEPQLASEAVQEVQLDLSRAGDGEQQAGVARRNRRADRPDAGAGALRRAVYDTLTTLMY